jgi:hypothetical protein
MKLKITLLAGLLIFVCAMSATAQDEPVPTPTPTPTATTTATPDPDAEIQKEIDRLRKQKELEEARNQLETSRMTATTSKIAAIREALPKVTENSSREGAGTPDANNIDSIALSFEALKELSSEISQELQKLGKTELTYNRYIVYNEGAFNSLAHYRLFRSQAKTIISRYNKLKNLVDEANQANDSGLLLPSFDSEKGRGGLDGLLTGLNIPSFMTPVVKSVGELISLFRPTITESTTLYTDVSQSAFVAAVATEIQSRDSEVKFFYPEAFVPSYEWDDKKEDSVLMLMSKIYIIKNGLTDFQTQFNALSVEDRKKLPEIAKLIPTLGIIRSQAEPLCPDAGDNDGPTRGQDAGSGSATKLMVTDLIKGEKVDEMMKGDKNSRTAILQLSVLKAGGTRRTSSSLIFGNKTRYSGSVMVQVLLFDNDGELKLSRTFFRHTGFRKL